MAWVNGHPVGRFWTQAGPQQALFVPGVWLKQGANEVVVLELDPVPGGSTAHLWSGAEPDFSGACDAAWWTCWARYKMQRVMRWGTAMYDRMFLAR